MSETRINVTTADGVMDVYLHRADAGTPAPAVILFPDAGGVRAAMHEKAAHLADAGYVVALANMFFPAGEFAPFDMGTVFSDPPERARLMAVMATAAPDVVMPATDALIDVLAADPGVVGDRVGVMGYCAGGRMAFVTAGALPSRIAAAASIHGGGLATDDPSSPHLRAAAIEARLYFGVADNDASCSPQSQAMLTEALDQAKVDYQLEVYPGAAHGFAVGDFPIYDKAADDQHWQRVTALFGAALPAS